MMTSAPFTSIPRNSLRAARYLAGALMVASVLCGTAVAEQGVNLFKIVTVRDEIVVGVGAQEAATLGGNDVTAVGRALKGGGELTVWQYAVRKAPDGELEQAPLRRISIIGNDSLRVEPYATPLRVVVPK